MHTAILLPRQLYGDRETTRKEWAKVARRAWRAGNWDDVVTHDEMVPLSDREGDILLERGYFNSGRLQKEVHWRPYWTSKSVELLSASSRDFSAPGVRERISAWLLSGMEHLWFTIGMLRYEDGDVPDPITEPLSARLDYRFELLKRFVRWLPEIAAPAGRYASETWRSDYVLHELPYFWIVRVVRCAVLSGWNIELPADARKLGRAIDNDFNGNVCDWLIGCGIIEPDGQRYRLRPRPADISHLP